MKTIHFNTGRRYTAYGQRITATLHDDGIVTYYDHDRMVHGSFVMPQHCRLDQTEVMHWYDSGITGGPIGNRAWEDAMHRGGCNSKYEG